MLRKLPRESLQSSVRHKNAAHTTAVCAASFYSSKVNSSLNFSLKISKTAIRVSSSSTLT